MLKDNTVRLSGFILDVPPGPRGRSYAGRHVDVRQLLDGTWRVYDADLVIATSTATAHRELRARRRRKQGRGAPAGPPAAAVLVQASDLGAS